MKNRSIISISLLAIFLLVMVPSINAVEYNQVKETQTQLIESHIPEISKRIPINDIGELKGILKRLFSIDTFQKIKGLFDDPGDGEDNNGPDDWTDYLYIFGAILCFWGYMLRSWVAFIIVIAPYPIMYHVLLYILYDFITSYSIFNFAFEEFHDIKDWDGDGR